jgi:hypothetical protein
MKKFNSEKVVEALVLTFGTIVGLGLVVVLFTYAKAIVESVF